MKFAILILALAVLLQSGFAADQRLVKWSQINLSQSLPEDANITMDDGFLAGAGGIVFNGTAPAVTTNVLYSDAGNLKWNGAAIGGTEDAAFEGGNNSLVVGGYPTDWSDDYVPVRMSVGATAANSSARYGLLSYMSTTNALGAGSPVGNTYQRLLLQNGFDAYGWGNTVWLTDYSTSDTGENTGYYARVEGNKGGSQLWGMAIEVWDTVRDESSNHNRNIIGLEIVTNKAYGSGLVSGQSAIGLHILSAGNKTQTAGIKIDRQTLTGMSTSYFQDGILIADGVATRAINVTATTPVGLDTSFGTFSAAAIRLGKGQAINFDIDSTWSIKESADGTKLEFYNGATRRGYVDATGWHNG